MSSTFTPSQAIDMSKEKDWPLHLGMLDWDNTSIIFTKRSLVEFLKYTGVTIDPGFTNIQKLPRYARFGNIAANSGPEETTTKGTISPTPAIQSSINNDRLLGEEFPDDALATAPQQPASHHLDDSTESSVHTTRRVRTVPGGTSSIAGIFSDVDTEQFVPTRRVRQRPGGTDNIEGLF